MKKVFLLGMMGVGKTFWSGKWAKRLQVPVYDLDRFVEEKEGMSIPKIFDQKGEMYFREKESYHLKTFAQQDKFLLATGGGTPCYYDNMQWMNDNGITIWLNEPIEIIIGRLKNSKQKRPLLANLSPKELSMFIENKMNERRPFYQQAQYILSGKEISNHTFDTIISLS